MVDAHRPQRRRDRVHRIDRGDRPVDLRTAIGGWCDPGLRQSDVLGALPGGLQRKTGPEEPVAPRPAGLAMTIMSLPAACKRVP